MHGLSDGAMASTFHVPSLRSPEGFGVEPTHRNRSRLKLLTWLHPNAFLSEEDKQVLQQLRVDGHWLFASLVGHLSFHLVDPLGNRHQRTKEVDGLMFYLQDALQGELVNGCLAEGQDDDEVGRYDALVEEELPKLIPVCERIVYAVLDVLAGFDPPSDVKELQLDRCINGYSLAGDYGGYLHFDLQDHEVHSTL